MKGCLIIICCFFFAHCGEFEVLDYNKQVRKSADSLYRIKRPLYQKMADSICVSKIEAFRQIAIDSLKIDRLEEIKRLVEDQ